MKKLLLLAGATLFMAACSEASTAPSALKSARDHASRDVDLTCRSGYIVAYDENGEAYCKPDDSTLSGRGVVLPPDSTGGPDTPP